VGWGTGDFLTARSARKTNVHNAWVWTYALAALLWVAFGLAQSAFQPLSFVELVLALAAGLGLSAGDILFISAARSGKIAVASPLFSLSAVVAMALGVAILGERPGLLQLGLAALALCGGVLIGVKDLKLRSLEDAAPILLPGIVFHGIGLTFFKVLVDHLGAWSAAAWFQALMLAYLIPFAWINRKQVRGPLVENGAAALAYFVGLFGFATALSVGVISLAAPVANLFPLVAVGLAVLVYGEKLQRHQWAGLLLAILALVGLAL